MARSRRHQRTLNVVVPSRAVLAAGGAFVSALAVIAAVSSPARVENAALAVQPRAAIGNPVDGDNGFLVFLHHNADVSSNENEGTMALGGDLLLHGDYRVANHPPTRPYTVPGDAQPTGLLIGGKIDWANSSPTGKLQVLSSAYVKLGDQTGTDILNPTTLTTLVPTGAGADSPAHVMLTTAQSAESVVAPGLIDFDSAFTAYEQRSTEMATCENNVTPTDAAGNPLTMPWSDGTQAYLTLSTTETNVWNVTTSQLAALSNITLRTTPPAAAPLVVNVIDDSGTGEFDWTLPPLAGFSAPAAPYTLWNFPDLTTLKFLGSNSIDGAIYAPKADLSDYTSGNIQGSVIANSLVHQGPVALEGTDGGGEIHDFPFAGDVECASPTDTGTATPTEPTTPPTTETVTPTEPTTPPTTGESTPPPTETTPAPTSGTPTHTTPPATSPSATGHTQPPGLAATGDDHTTTGLILAAATLLAGLAMTTVTRRRRSRRH